MSGRTGARRRRRIIITLGDGTPEDSLLRDVMLLAAGAFSEIEGVFIEDAELFQLAALPFARQISRATGHAGPIEAPEIERHLRRQAELSRQTLATAAERAGVAWRFRVTRGVLAHVISSAIDENDLAVLSASRSPLTLATAARGGPVGVVIDGTESGWRALELAANLAQASGQSVVAFVSTADPPEAASGDTADQRLQSLPHEIRAIPADDDEALFTALHAARLGAVVLPAMRALAHPALARRLHRDLGLPAYLIR